MDTLFNMSTVTGSKPHSGIACCGACGLAKNAVTPRMEVTGKGRKKILIVNDSPTDREDRQGKRLIGKYGYMLCSVFNDIGIDLKKDCWYTTALICTGTPNDIKIEACRPNLIKTINKLKPNVIILLGHAAIKSLIGFVWKENIGYPSCFIGYTIPSQKINTWIVPTYNPVTLLADTNGVMKKLFIKHIKTAIKKCKKKPFKNVPDYVKQIEIINSPRQAGLYLKDMYRKTKCFAFDYETTCLKPQYWGAKIVSCSVCFDGDNTIAYPFAGKAVDGTVKLLKSKTPKIASNIKFEHKWTKNKLGFDIRRWYWDTMLAAHIINNSKGVTSVKFQSFVLLGNESYDEHIKPYLESGKYKINRIKELDLRELLLYNGIDSLVEYRVAMKQIKILNSWKGN